MIRINTDLSKIGISMPKNQGSFLKKYVSQGGERHIVEVRPPKLWESLFSPRSRFSKGVLDIITTLQVVSSIPGLQRQTEAYEELLINLTRERVQVVKDASHLQVMIVRGSGYEESRRPIYEHVFRPVALDAKASA